MWELTFVRKVKNKWKSIRNMFSRSSTVAKEGHDVISVTLHLGVTSMERRRFPQKSGINMKDPKFPYMSY